MIKKFIGSALLLPISLLLWLVFLLDELVHLTVFSWAGNSTAQEEQAPNRKVKPDASLVILNWNGASLLEECLPSVVEAVRFDGGNHEIIVIDNGSTDKSVELLHERFPQVRVVCLERNYGFIEGYNRGIRQAKKDILVLLNNDMRVEKDFLRPLLDGFRDENVFSVSAQIFFWDATRRREETGKTRAFWSRGMIQYSHEAPNDEDTALGCGPAFWLGGGSAAVDREKFLQLGGFDRLLRPLYVEDVDLSYRAWKRGWKVLFCPQSKVIHKHRSTSGRLDRASLERIIQRNHLLFIWKNISDPGMTAEHLLSLPLLPWRRSWGMGIKDTLAVVCMALGRLPEALVQRERERGLARMKDRDIFAVANDALAYKQTWIPPRRVQPGDRLNILFVTPYYPSLRHGGGVRMFQMIRSLSQQHNISLLTFWDNESDHEYFEQIEAFCQKVVAIERHPVVCRPLIPSYPPAVTLDFGDPAFGAALRKYLIEDDFDIVQCEFLQTGYQIPLLKREGLVLTEHEVQNAAQLTRLSVDPGMYARVRQIFQWLRWLYAEMRLAQKFDRVVAVTGEDAWSLQRYNPHLPVEVIHTGVDEEYYLPEAGACEPDSLVYLGNFSHPPNVDSALVLANEILPRVREQIPGVRLYIVGAGPTPQISALAREDEVIVTGWVDDTRPYLAQASLAVFPIRLGVGIRTKILESLAMGKAVITTPLGAAGLHPVHGENIWVAGGVEDFAQGIVTLLRDPQTAAKIGEKAREFIELERSWKSAAALQTHSYYQMLEERDAEYPLRHYLPASTRPFYRPIGLRLGYLTTAVAYGVVLTRGLPYLMYGLASRGKSNPFQTP